MTDHDLQQRLRAWYRAEVDRDEGAPLALRAELTSLVARDRHVFQPRWLPTGPRLWAWGLAAAVAVVVLVMGIAAVVGPPRVGPSPGPVLPSDPAATPTPSERVNGWPHHWRNPAGIYSWDGATCAHDRDCSPVGTMSNAYGSGDITIIIGQTIAAMPDDGVTTVLIGGHPGTYRARSDMFGVLREAWVFDVDGTRIAVDVEIRPSASEAERDEAHAIVDSIRTEAHDDARGFRVVFTLPSNDWTTMGDEDMPPARHPAPPTPSAPAASATTVEHVSGWPNTSRNAPGIYSWNGSRCSRTPNCNVGFMHNGNGSGDVTILVGQTIAAFPSQGVTPITVAGHPGTYRSHTDDLGALHEEWVFEVEGTRIAIDLSARPETSQKDLDEAHAVIASMRTEARDADPGFRLIFTLATGDWDSG